jgi:hypothetical protein
VDGCRGTEMGERGEVGYLFGYISLQAVDNVEGKYTSRLA